MGRDAADTVTGSANADTIDGGAGIDNTVVLVLTARLVAPEQTRLYSHQATNEAGVDTVTDLDIANDTLSFDLW